MIVYDAGPDDCVNEGGPDLIRYGCPRCGHKADDWVNRKNKTDALRNRPECPRCNAPATGATPNVG
jgi:transposase-like protein